MPLPLLKLVHKISCYRRNNCLLSNALLAGSRRELHVRSLLYLMSLLLGLVWKEILRRNLQADLQDIVRFFWIFYMKSVQLVMCDSDFPVRGYSVCVRKRDKLYVEECMMLIIDLEIFGLYDFWKPV